MFNVIIRISNIPGSIFLYFPIGLGEFLPPARGDFPSANGALKRIPRFLMGDPKLFFLGSF